MKTDSTLGSGFWRLWGVTGLSSIGSGLTMLGFPLLALSLTRNAILISAVAVVGRTPALIIALPFGTLVDRRNRRKLLFRLQIARFAAAAAFAGCVIAGAIDLFLLYVAAFVLGSLTVAFDCTASASLRSIVRRQDLVRANARLSTVVLTAQDLVGQAIGGVAFAAAQAIPFVADAVAFLTSTLLLRGAVPDNQPTTARSSFLVDLRSGAHWFWQSSLTRVLAGVVAQLAFCQAMVYGVLVLFATQDLHLTKASYGLLLGLTAIGSFAAAASANRLNLKIGAGWSVLGAGLLAAASYPVLAVTTSQALACVALAVESGAVFVGIVAAQSLRQATVPADLQGRVASAWMTIVLSAAPLGGLTGGLLAAGIGIRHTFLAAGCLQFVVVAAAGPRLLRRIHEESRTDEAPNS